MSELPLRVDPTAPIPLATQLSQQLTWLIASKQLDDGDELPPIRGLAAQLDINLHTVRAAYRQLSADGLVSMRSGRRATVRRYDRSRAARSDLPSFSIGAILPGFAPFYAPLLRGIEAAAAESPAMVFICNAHEDPAVAATYVDQLMAKQVDGIIVVGTLLEADPALGESERPAMVSVDAPGASGSSVGFDLEGSQYAATRHLIDHGHERIGYVSAPVELPNVAPKLLGYQAALAAADLSLDPDLVVAVPDFQIRSGEYGAHQLLGRPNPPHAIATASDELAMGAFHAISSRGLRVPEDIALVGNDDIEMAAVIRPALTTVALPVEVAGRRAVAMLQELITGNQPDPSQVVLDVELVVRQSCGCPGGNDIPLP